MIAMEVLKGQLGPGMDFQPGMEIRPVMGENHYDAKKMSWFLIFYEKRLGAMSWTMTAPVSDTYEELIKELRKANSESSAAP